MAIVFNADEIFKMAIRIEENGAAFYRKAATTQSEQKDRDLLEELAAMEDGHAATFKEMQTGLTKEEQEETVFDPNNEIGLYLNANADAHGGEGAPSVADSLTGNETMEEIVETAIGLEKKSILFYLGLKDLTPEHLGKDKVDHIIGEEKKHVAQLAGILAQKKGS